MKTNKMETKKWKEFKGVRWNTDELLSCKQAAEILYRMGLSEKELLTLDFGNLDIIGVTEETGLSTFC